MWAFVLISGLQSPVFAALRRGKLVPGPWSIVPSP